MRLFGRGGRAPGSGQSVAETWRLYRRDRKYRTALGSVMGIAVLWLEMRFRA